LTLWLPYQIYVALGMPLANRTWERPNWETAVWGFFIILFSMLLHEGLHGLALWLGGHRPRLSFQEGFLLATIPPGDFLTRREYLWMTLTPLFTISIGGGVSLLWLPHAIGKWALAALLLNTAASIGDLLVAQRVYRLPPTALFADNQGIKVYRPVNEVAETAELRRIAEHKILNPVNK
jgi:hypothetical protein